MRKPDFLFFILALLLLSCEDNYLADPFEPRLPQYSEEGRNEAGAFIDGEAWSAQSRYAPLQSPNELGRIYVKEDSTYSGIALKHGYLLTDTEAEHKIEMLFVLQDFFLLTPDDLISLEDRRFDFSENGHYAELHYWNDFYVDTLKGINGSLYIRYVEDKNNFTILSGTFGFETSPDDSLVKVYSGRFDVALEDDEIRPWY